MVKPSQLIRQLNGDVDVSPVQTLSSLCIFLGVVPPFYEVTVERKNAWTLFNRCDCSIDICGNIFSGSGCGSRSSDAKIAAAQQVLDQTRTMFLQLIQSEQENIEANKFRHPDPVGGLIQLSSRLQFPDPLFIIQRHKERKIGFVCSVHTHFGKERVYSGVGRNKRIAKAEAARVAISQLNKLLYQQKPRMHWGYK